MRAQDISEISQMSIPEKILLLEDLWDSIASNESEVPLPEGHAAELDRRFMLHIDSTEDFLSLKELKQRVERRK
jgi:putative addiction module component (TIGR02574 family)